MTMPENGPLEVVFLTSFSDFCYRSIPAIAQMADDFAMRLTIMHTTSSPTPSVEDRMKVESFFPEADAYAYCRRMTVQGDPVDALRRLSLKLPVDLVIAPASDPLGLPRFWHQSLRARLLRELQIPLWTMDRHTKPDKLRKPPRRVGCWIDFHPRWTRHIAFASEYARAVGAELHILHALPEVTDGMVPMRDQPLTANAVADAVRQVIGRSAVTQMHLSENDSRGTRKRLVEKSEVDLVFVADTKPQMPFWLAPNPRLMNECACPVVYVPVDTMVPVWSLSKARRAPAPEQVRRVAYA
jgi:hypothetical protein